MTLRSTLTRTLACAVLVGGTVAAQSLPASATASSATCANVIQIVARGSNETAGTGGTTNVYSSGGLGRMSGIASSVASGTTKTVRTVGLKYPAAIVTWSDGYVSSLLTGRSRLASELNRLASLCPSSRTVLIGYSQGAHVIGDVTSNSNPNGLSTAAKSRIAAVFLTGDPSRRYGEPFNRGTGTGGGFLGNRAPGQLSGLGSRIISYCYKGDVFCDFAHVDLANGSTIHGSYGNTTLRSYASSFIRSKI